MTQRVAALENQVQSLTGQVEQDGYRLRQIEDGFSAYKRATDARLKALEDGGAQIGASGDPVIAPVDIRRSAGAADPARDPPARRRGTRRQADGHPRAAGRRDPEAQYE